jgi:multiple sugar transport system substrate-binding protein
MEPDMKARAIAVTAALVAAAAGLAACGSSSSSSSSSPKTLTYWASNQGRTLQQDQQVLTAELKKFTQQTGIKVNLEVIPWTDLENRILSATSSGQGPDVLNIGNTWSASLAATGAFLPFDNSTYAKVGGPGKFIPSTLTSAGAPGKTPDFVPLYGLAYGLYYNKQEYSAAGITQPPQTWADLVSDAKKLTVPSKGQYGMCLEGGSYTEGVHFAFMFGEQNGASLLTGSNPGFSSAAMVAGVKQYTDLMSADKVVSTADAQYENDAQVLGDFTKGKCSMMMLQSEGVTGLTQDGMSTSAFGVAPIPLVSPLPPGGHKVATHVAGINIGIFKNTKNEAGALKLVNFLTSPSEQDTLNANFGDLPVTPQSYSDPRFQGPDVTTFQKVLANESMTMPMKPDEAQFETLVGNAVKTLIAQAATGKPVAAPAIQAALNSANKQMQASGG